MNLAAASGFANDVLSAFSHAQHVFTDPIFLARFALSAIEVAAAPDDESKRGAAQGAVLRLQREFK
ncbi:hypothetical protein EHF33_15880 [Deinococcus psychrotolerans]|uniref:Uncharacterized protein n=1 Tax=Deinococcus psychrotolerans TaxID=2489213 RepID=A0A3G8YHN9_9DEIO|nr:hypothetical protein [Deinococcus psychrotolerans]AZI44360.1 hypothetical protein EHF33_15880 [Deinococcus psychrotolerans]